jgi:WD40 repeat protein
VVGSEKGHSDDVFALEYNPVTDHVVAVGKKFIRFFGVKEGVEEPRSDARDAKLSSHESNLWAKRGIFGKRALQQDLTCVAFDAEGITYAGTASGFIYRFAEQTMDLAVKAHWLAVAGSADGKECKVTALWHSSERQELVSSGDDGLIKVWRPSAWAGSGREQPVKVLDLNQWVDPKWAPTSAVCNLQGPPVKLDALGAAPGESKGVSYSSPAAAHSLCGDKKGRLLIGTVCNEIYELQLDNNQEAPICYMQSHYDETWGLAAHPTKAEFATTSEDNTVRVWDQNTCTMKCMARLPGPGRSVAYSPDGRLLAVGIGSGGKAKGRSNVPPARFELAPSRAPSSLPTRRLTLRISLQAHDGKWIVFRCEANALVTVAEPPQIRSERIADIKFSPDGLWVAVASAENYIDIYGAAGDSFEHRRTLKGHSSYVRKVDWSADSRHLQSCCGAYELLYWRLFSQRDGKEVFRPEQAARARPPRPPTPRSRPPARLAPSQERLSSTMKDEEWDTHSCIFGWGLRGIWPEDSDGTDINSVARSRGTTGHEGLLATADDLGKVKLFRYPCVVPRANTWVHCIPGFFLVYPGISWQRLFALLRR